MKYWVAARVVRARGVLAAVQSATDEFSKIRAAHPRACATGPECGRYARCMLMLALLAALAVSAQVANAQSDSNAAPTPVWPTALARERHGHRIEPLDGGLLCFGGFGDPHAEDRESRQTWWLAPGATEWKRRADLRRQRAFFGSAVIAGVVYAIGADIERYDAKADAWVEVTPPGKLPRSHFGAAALEGKLFVLGGYGAAEAALWVVDVKDGAVRAEPPPPGFAKGDHFHLVHALRGELHVIGGLDGETFRVQREHWVRGAEGWRALPAPPEGLWAKFSAHTVVGESLYVFGENGGWRFDAAEGAWRELAQSGSMLAMPATAVHDDKLWILGGMEVGRNDARVLRAFDLRGQRWLELAPRAK